MSTEPIVIVGAGQAGSWAAKTLRSEGFTGRIVLLGEEAHPPHERPPLSKAVLAGTAGPETTHLFKADDLAKLDLDFRPDTRVAAIDRAARTITVQSGETLAYARLILCTGSRVRTLGVPGADAPCVHYLRTVDDSLALHARLVAGRHLIVIGGGWIGLEVAATARKRGLDVTVIEALDRLCARGLPPELSDHLLALHTYHGVAVRLGVGVSGIEPSADGVTVILADGSRIAGDRVVVGIGVIPNTELAAAAGLAVDNGIVVDDAGRTADAAIFAAGDCTNLPLACLDRRVRLESWANAQNQAIVAAKAALGQDVRYDELPWFWSDQYDMNLQMLGYPARWSDSVVRGDRASGSFSRFYLEDGHLSAIISVNAPRDLRAARKLLQTRKPVRPEDLADPTVQLQRL